MYKLLIEDKNSYSALWVYVNVFVAAVMIEKICEVTILLFEGFSE